MHGQMENKHQFARALPRLTKYLNSYPVVGLNNTSQWMEKLVAVCKDLKRDDERGERYMGQFDELIKGYLRSREYEALMEKEAMPSSFYPCDLASNEFVKTYNVMKKMI